MARTKGYRSNPLLPPPDYEVKLTEHELREYTRCMNDPIYFISTYVKIVHVDRGIINFEPWSFQKEMIQSFCENRFSICLMARQIGKSSCVIQGYFLWYVLFQTDVNVAILANKEETAIDLLGRLKFSFECLPAFLKQGVVTWDQKSIKFANNSRVQASATSTDAVRGRSYNAILLDEYAFVPEHIAEQFNQSVFPTISSGTTTKLIIVSTPKGYNHYHRLWVGAVKGENGFKALKYIWSDVPLPERHIVDEHGVNLWEKQMRAQMGDMAFEQEHNCVAGPTLVTLKDTVTGEIKIMSIEDVYLLLSQTSDVHK